jgi:hypothetical protein
MKNQQQLLSYALEAMQNHPAFRGTVKRETVGYIAAFGPTVLRMGLLPTLAVYQFNTETPGRKKVLECLRAILLHPDARFPDQDGINTHNDLYHYADSLGTDNVTELRRRLLEASVGLKLAVRSLKIS